MNKLKVVLFSHFVKLADNRYRIATVLATVVSVKIPRVNAKAVPPYDYTHGILGNMYLLRGGPERFQHIGQFKPYFLRNFIVFFKCFNRCAVKIHHFVVRVEP